MARARKRIYKQDPQWSTYNESPVQRGPVTFGFSQDD